MFDLLEGVLKFSCRHRLQTVCVLLFVIRLDGFLQTDQHILVTFDFLFQLILSCLSFLYLEMKGLDISLNLFYTLYDFFLENLLTVLDIRCLHRLALDFRLALSLGICKCS